MKYGLSNFTAHRKLSQKFQKVIQRIDSHLPQELAHQLRSRIEIVLYLVARMIR